MEKLPITVIILTLNEEKNIRACLDSVCVFAEHIIVVDSFSTDNTLRITEEYNAKIYQNPFINYSKQRNWALTHLEIETEWVMNIDADNRVTEEIIDELINYFNKGIPPNITGFMASRRTMFMNRWIKFGGHYPVFHGVIFRKGFGYCEEKEYDQHFVIQGDSIILKGDIIDIITDSLDTFTTRHNKWATLEAKDILALQNSSSKLVKPDKNGNPMEKRRYQRMKYYSYPPFLRVFIYFIYRYIFKMGFRDGKEGMIFHFLQGFWFRFLVDAKIYELKKNKA